MLTQDALEGQDCFDGADRLKEDLTNFFDPEDRVKSKALETYRGELNRPYSRDLGLHGVSRASLRTLCKAAVIQSSKATKKRYTQSMASSAMQEIHEEKNAINALRLLKKERLMVSRLGFPDRAMELDEEIAVMTLKAREARREQEEEMLAYRMKGLAMSQQRKEQRFEFLLSEETRKLEERCQTEEEKFLARQEAEFVRVLESATRRAVGKVKKCACTLPYLCRHNKTASYNTRRPSHVVVQYRRNAKRLKQAGRPEEAAMWAEKANILDEQEQEKWRISVANSIVSSPWGANEAAVDQVTELHKRELTVLRKTHAVMRETHDKRHAMRRKTFQNTMLAEARKVRMQCRKQAILRQNKDLAEEYREKQRTDRLSYQSEGLKNVSRNLLGDGRDGGYDEESAKNKPAVDWVPPAAFGLANSVRLIDAAAELGVMDTEQEGGRILTSWTDIKKLDPERMREKIQKSMHETVDNIRYSSEVDYNDSIDSGVGDRAGEDEGADDDDQDYVMGQTSGSKLVDRMRKLNLERSTEKPSATPIPTAPMTYTAAPIAVGSSSAADSCTTAAVPHATTEFSASADAHSAVFPAPTPASPFTLAAHIRTTAPAFAAASAIHCTPTNTSTPPWRAVQARTSTPFPGAPTSGLFSPTTEQASTAGHPCFGSFGSATEHAAPPDTSSSAFNSWNPSLFPLKAFAFAVNPFQQRHTGFPNYAGTPAGQFLKTENSFQCDAEQKEVESAAIHRDFPAEKPDTSSSATAGNLAKASTVVPFAPLAPSAPSPSNRSFRSGLHIVHTPPTLTEPAAPPTDTAPVPVVGTIAQGSDDQQDSAEEALTPPPQSPTACMPVSPVSDPINAPDPSQAAECEAQSQLESARDQQAACTTSIAAEPAHTDCTVRLSPQQLKQLHERAPDWVFDPLLDTRDPQFKPGSVRDEDWAEHDALLAQSCGHENSYGTSLVLPILLQTTGTVDPATPSDALGKAGTAAKIILKSTAAAVSEKKGVLNTKKVRFGAVATHIFDDDTGAHATGLCNNRNDVFPAALQPPFIADITHSNYFDEESKEKSTMAPVIPQETSISPVPRVTNENITNFSGTFTTRTAADAPAFTPAWLTPKPWVPSLACAQPHTSIGLPVGMDSVVKQPQSPHWQALTPVTHGFGGGNDWLTFRYSAMLKSSTPHISPHNKFSAANFAVGNSDEAQYASNSADANSCLTTADSDVRATQQWIAIPPLNSSGNLGAFPYARIPSEPAVKPSAPSSETLTLKVDSLHDGGSPNGGGMPHTNGEFTAAAQQTPVLQPATVQDSGVYDALQNKTAAEDKGSKTMIDATASTTSASSDCYSAGGGSFVA